MRVEIKSSSCCPYQGLKVVSKFSQPWNFYLQMWPSSYVNSKKFLGNSELCIEPDNNCWWIRLELDHTEFLLTIENICFLKKYWKEWHHKYLENYIKVHTGFVESDMVVINLVNTRLDNYTMTRRDSLTDA